MGTSYLIEHCLEQYQTTGKQKAFDMYTSEMLRSIANSISAVIGGSAFEKSWQEMQDYKPETRDPEEIKSDIVSKLKALG